MDEENGLGVWVRRGKEGQKGSSTMLYSLLVEVLREDYIVLYTEIAWDYVRHPR